MASVLERIPRIRVCVKQDGQGIIVKQVQKPFWNQKTLNNTMFNQLLEVALYFVTELEGCRNVSCLNGGTCNSSFGNFSCVCPLGYWGEFCELGMISKHTLFTVYDHAIIPFHNWWEKFSFFCDRCWWVRNFSMLEQWNVREFIWRISMQLFRRFWRRPVWNRLN